MIKIDITHNQLIWEIFVFLKMKFLHRIDSKALGKCGKRIFFYSGENLCNSFTYLQICTKIYINRLMLHTNDVFSSFTFILCLSHILAYTNSCTLSITHTNTHTHTYTRAHTHMCYHVHTHSHRLGSFTGIFQLCFSIWMYSKWGIIKNASYSYNLIYELHFLGFYLTEENWSKLFQTNLKIKRSVVSLNIHDLLQFELFFLCSFDAFYHGFNYVEF